MCELDEADYAAGLAVQRRISQLRSRAYLDYRDPDALTEEELEALEELEEWEP